MRKILYLLPLCLMVFSFNQSLSAFDSSCEFLEGVRVKKKYLTQKDVLVSHKGIFVLINGVPCQASILRSDSNGVFVMTADESKQWECPRCGRPTNSGEICDNCSWPLYDDLD